MNPETLELYVDEKMQKFFEKFKGEWRNGDNYYCPRNDSVNCAHDYFAEEGKSYEPCCPDVAQWLPDPISRDDSKPQRGLWGMVDWSRVNAHADAHDGTFIMAIWPSCARIASGTPTLALLKALKHQIEQEASHDSDGASA